MRWRPNLCMSVWWKFTTFYKAEQVCGVHAFLWREQIHLGSSNQEAFSKEPEEVGCSLNFPSTYIDSSIHNTIVSTPVAKGLAKHKDVQGERMEVRLKNEKVIQRG